jgi:hypothetical protein
LSVVLASGALCAQRGWHRIGIVGPQRPVDHQIVDEVIVGGRDLATGQFLSGRRVRPALPGRW